MSGRSSIAVRAAIVEMGFTVHTLSPGRGVSVGDLRFEFFSPDHRPGASGDEWDVLQFLAYDTGNDGSFFSYVDARPTEETLAHVFSRTKRLGLFCQSNNSTNWSFQTGGKIVVTEPPADTLQVAVDLIAAHSRLRFQGNSPAATLITGGGFSFTDRRAWLNHNVFFADSTLVATALLVLCPGERFFAPIPGTTIEMQDGQIARVLDETPFLKAEPRTRWPDRTYHGNVAIMDDYPSACGTTRMSAADWVDLENGLVQFARFLFGRSEFLEQLSASSEGREGRSLRLAVVFLEEDDFRVFEYAPERCSFLRVDCEQPAERYAAGLEIWAPDFLAVLRAQMGPLQIVFGSSRSWNHSPDVVHISTSRLLEFFSPLADPARALALYRGAIADLSTGKASSARDQRLIARVR